MQGHMQKVARESEQQKGARKLACGRKKKLLRVYYFWAVL